MLEEVADAVVNAADVGGVALVDVGPALLGRLRVAIVVPGCPGVVGVGVAVFFPDGGVDHFSFFTEPLEAFLWGRGWVGVGGWRVGCRKRGRGRRAFQGPLVF